MTPLLLTISAALAGYLACLVDQRRKRRPDSSEWWDGWQAGRDHGLAGRRVGAGRTEHDEKGAEQ